MKKLNKRQRAIKESLMKYENEVSKKSRNLTKTAKKYGEKSTVYILEKAKFGLDLIQISQKSRILFDEFETIEQRKGGR